MTLEMNRGAAWICVAAGALLQALLLGAALRRRGLLRAANCWILLLPAALGLGLARGGFEALQAGDRFSDFRWCYTLGLAGMACGTALAARIAGGKPMDLLDENAFGICLAMAFARGAQRWMGEAGIGPILEQFHLFTMVNDWEEPVLATWAVEAAACLLAAGAVLAAGRRKPRHSGGSFWLAVFFLLIPQILIEQFRSGAYLRFEMMRLEQALFALFALAGIADLCAQVSRGAEKGRAGIWWPVPAFLACCGAIAFLQFVLDGKLAEWPAELCWALYAAMIAGMLAIAWAAVRRADQRGNGKDACV